jgi:hypothetical protein
VNEAGGSAEMIGAKFCLSNAKLEVVKTHDSIQVRVLTYLLVLILTTQNFLLNNLTDNDWTHYFPTLLVLAHL